MNVVDSSAWLEYFSGGPNAGEFSRAIETPEALVVPTLTLFEVFKRISGTAGEGAAFEAIGVMLQGRVSELSASLAVEAARLSLETRLAMADAVILATARASGATLWTQDAHFADMAGVEYRPPSAPVR